MDKYVCSVCNSTIHDKDLKYCPNCCCSINGKSWNEYETVEGFGLDEIALKLNKLTKENDVKVITTAESITGTLTALVKLKQKR